MCIRDRTYTFLSVVNAITEQQARRRWKIKFPTVVERNERRLVRRHRVMGRVGFHLTSDMLTGQRDEWLLYDIAAAGVSFVVDSKFKLELGTVFCDPSFARLRTAGGHVSNAKPASIAW